MKSISKTPFEQVLNAPLKLSPRVRMMTGCAKRAIYAIKPKGPGDFIGSSDA